MPDPANLVWETSTDTGTGNLTLTTRVQSFADAFGVGGTDVFDYFIWNESVADEWEYGTGSVLSGQLIRDTVTGSSNSGALVSFSAGTKNIANDIPSENQAQLDVLASTAANDGASLVGIQDSGAIITATTVEGALAELATATSAGVKMTSDQTISTSTITTLAFDAEDWDSDSIHDTSTNNSRLTAPRAGKYIVTLSLVWGNNNTGLRQLFFYKNGSSVADVIFPNNGGGEDSAMVAITLDLAASDYIETKVWQNSGGNLAVQSSRTRFTISYHGA